MYDARRPTRFNLSLRVGSTTETVEVNEKDVKRASDRIEHEAKQKEKTANLPSGNAASVNVLNLQQRVAGVLPVRVDVPRAGNSYCFVRPLVLDEETKVTFSYNSR